MPPDTRHLVDPELLPVLEQLPQFEFSAETLAAIRTGLGERFMPVAEPPIAPVEKVIEGPAGPLEVFLFDPSPGARDRPALLHIHGGGMIIGSARAAPHGPSSFAASLGVPVASVEYRLAPETPFPGPQEDCFAALRWLADEADALGVDPQRIAVIGESAGGGLAAAVAHMARDRGGPALAGQVLIYPMLDHRVGGDADPWRNRHTGEFVWTRGSNRFGWEALRGDYRPDDERKGWFSPSLAADLSGLPPAWIGVGNLDLFFDEDLDYARRLVDAGVPVELHAYPGAFHGFNMGEGSRVAKAFARDMIGGTARLLGLDRS
ncbi:MAG: alpha/beta hydrolase [Novosphingobium sp.]